MRGNPIPALARARTRTRAGDLCERCSCPGSEIHHRRGRAVLDAHTHCGCNLVLLCNACHRWAHAHPFEAKAEGFIIGRSQTEMWNETLVVHRQPWLMLCSYDAIPLSTSSSAG